MALTLQSAVAAEKFVVFERQEAAICLTDSRDTIVYDAQDWTGVKMAVASLRQDLKSVTGRETAPIVVATVGKSKLAERYALQSKTLQGKTEQYLLFTDHGQLVILGSDKRGTIYGIYELSRQIGVSPWHFWADVPAEQHEELYVKEGCYTDGEPKVRYRGIFINDEGPCTSTWVKNTYGQYAAGTEYYRHCFDLLLRLKANYMWPAMWMWSFYADDPENSRLADDMGIIMGTSHHEPMARNHQEWIRHRDDYGSWNYAKNPKVLDQFFREGLERMKHTEDIVTIGMRGDGDAEMDGGNNIDLMKRIIKNQRKIIADVTKKPASKTPQVWALYKEVQEYYDQGLRLPDDVIYLLCDDNWGNLRRVPSAEERKHPGGWGLYYHVDYVGGPRNAKWLNITPIQGMWEQLSLAYNSGIEKLWVLNVGDLKPMEYPIDLFLQTAWYGPQSDPLTHLNDFCQQTFGRASSSGKDLSAEVARLINLYSKYAGRVTPEMLDANTYNVETGEWHQVTGDFVALEAEALRLLSDLKPEYEDCYRELVLFPIQAMANLYQMYEAVAMNHYFGRQNDPQANQWAEKARVAFTRDSLLCNDFNHKIADGKWDGMMVQKHIGYTSWNDEFLKDHLPALISVAEGADGGYTFKSQQAVVSMEAEHYYSAQGDWQLIPDLGRTLSGLKPRSEEAGLTYRFSMKHEGVKSVKIHVILKSTLDIHSQGGMYYTLALDQSAPQKVNFNGNLNENPENRSSIFYPTVARRLVDSVVECPLSADTDVHTLTITLHDQDMVIEKVVVDGGDYQPSYLFGTETYKSRTLPEVAMEKANETVRTKAAVEDAQSNLNFMQLWKEGPEFAVLPVGDYYQLPADSYLTWEEAMQTVQNNAQDWRLPTAEECHALIMKCRSEWTSVDGVYGRTYKSKDGTSDRVLFVPATGFMAQDQLNAQGHAGFFWTQSATDADHAYYFYVYSGEHHLFVDRKYFRYPIVLVVRK